MCVFNEVLCVWGPDFSRFDHNRLLEKIVLVA